MADRKKPGVAFWTTVVVVAILVGPVLYVASFGPVVWQIDAGRLHQPWRESACRIYRPLVDCAVDEQHFLARRLFWWATLGCDKRSGFLTLWMMQPFEPE